jgi:glutamate 5-kinase
MPKSKRPIIVVKIGTSTLTASSPYISRGTIESIARQITSLNEHYQVVLVTSGAVAAAKQFVSISGGNDRIASKQALSAIGQPALMRIYNEVFGDFGLRIAQCLMTYHDFDNELARTNILNTVNEVLSLGFIPVFNENDTVAVDELVLGDNDYLSALVACLVKAERLIIATDTDGLYDKNPKLYSDAKLIPLIHSTNEVIYKLEDTGATQGTGGMESKLKAAKICLEHQITTYLTNGSRVNFISNCINNIPPFTKCEPK